MNDAAHMTPPVADSASDGTSRDTRIFTGNVFRVRDRCAWALSEEPPPPPPAPVRRPTRVARRKALAHQLEAAIERGDDRHRRVLARRLRFTRARFTQILDLLLLAPETQEHELLLKALDHVAPLAYQALRTVVRHESWAEQWRAWGSLDQNRHRTGRTG